MPRPKKAIADSRRHILKFRVTDIELAGLRRQGEAAGLSPHECARLKACYGPAKAERGSPALPATAPDVFGFELRQDLRRVGVNLNQIARKLNTLDEHEPAELREVCATLNEILGRILAATPFD
jgi:Bacterial mobilisation protein (MobC)